MDHSHITALVVEDNRADVVLIQRMLVSSKGVRVQVETAARLADAIERIEQGGIDIVLLDLGLPDSSGLDTVRRVRAVAGDLPIIVLTGHDDEVLGTNAVWAGAQDYLVKGQVDATLLTRSLRYAISRQALQSQARRHGGIDQLTGLHDRSGFLAFLHQQLKLARRRRESLAVISVRVHDLARLRADLGAQEGDRLLLATAQLVQAALRACDVVGRVAPDALAVLAADATGDDASRIIQRLRNHLFVHRKQDASLQKLALVLGEASWEPGSPLSAEGLLAKASGAG